MRYAFFLFSLLVCVVSGADRALLFSSSDAPTLEELKVEFPSIDEATIARFLEDGQHVRKKLNSYLQWKNGHTIKSVDNDTERWNLAVQQGFDYVSKRQQGKVRAASKLDHAPKTESMYDTGLFDHQSHPVFVFYPSLLDLSLTGAVPLYTDIFITYIESFFAGVDPTEKFTLLFDIRPGRGWPNPTKTHLISAIKSMVSTVHELEPGRVSQVIVYPVPSYGTAVMNLLKPIATKNLHADIVLVKGSSTKLHSPVPVGELEKYVDRNVIDFAEEKRHSLFTPKTTVDIEIEQEGVTETGEEPEADQN